MNIKELRRHLRNIHGLGYRISTKTRTELDAMHERDHGPGGGMSGHVHE